MNQPIIRNSLADEVYERIRLSIFKNAFKPGQKLDIVEIAKQLDVSRQPVKEATNRLGQEGLLEIRQRVGTFVKKFELSDVKNTLDARLMIELFSLKNAVICEESLDILERIIDSMDQLSKRTPFDYLAFNAQDACFHTLLVGLADNEILLNMYKQLNVHLITARAFYFNALNTTLSDYGQHRRLLTYLRSGEKDEALKLLESHILHAKNELLALMEKGIF